jgi:hypothetical protein
VDESSHAPARTETPATASATSTETVTPTPVPATMMMRVAGGGDCLNVREGPGHASRIVTCLSDGAPVTALMHTNDADGYRWRELLDPRGWAAEDWLQPIDASKPDTRSGYQCLTGAGRFPYYFSFTPRADAVCTETTVAEFEAFRAERDRLTSRANVFPRDHESHEPPSASPTDAKPTPTITQRANTPAPYVPPSPPQVSTPACITPSTKPLPELGTPVSPPSTHQPVITLSQTVGRPGDEVSVYGYDFPPYVVVVIYGHGQLLTGRDGKIAGATTDAAGNFAIAGPVPPGLCPGVYIVQAVAIGSGWMASASFTITP